MLTVTRDDREEVVAVTPQALRAAGRDPVEEEAKTSIRLTSVVDVLVNYLSSRVMGRDRSAQHRELVALASVLTLFLGHWRSDRRIGRRPPHADHRGGSSAAPRSSWSRNPDRAQDDDPGYREEIVNVRGHHLPYNHHKAPRRRRSTTADRRKQRGPPGDSTRIPEPAMERWQHRVEAEARTRPQARSAWRRRHVQPATPSGRGAR